MKSKYVIINKSKAENWFLTANMFAKSLCPYEIALKQFNQLDAKKRVEIKKQFDIYDNIRRKNITKGEEATYFTSVMVDANIIATEFDINPLTAILCINSPCKPNERVVIK